MLRTVVAIVAALTLAACGAPSAPSGFIQTSDAYGPFSSAVFIEDEQANVVMTVQRGMGQLGFGLDFRGRRDPDGAWKVEYFCEPDNVLIVEDANATQTYYLPYLTWSGDLFVDANRATFESRRVPSMGTFASILPPDVPTPTPNVDITVSTSMMLGSSAAESLVTITNREATPKQVTLLYQDAAYLWFPDGDSRSVESIRIAATPQGFERHVNIVSAGRTAPGHWQFVGTFNRARGVVAGLLSMSEGEIAGVRDHYVGVQGRRDPTRLFALANFRNADIPTGDRGEIRHTPGFVNRFVALNFGTLAPGQSGTQAYVRIMTVLAPQQRNEDGIQAWVSSMVVSRQAAAH